MMRIAYCVICHKNSKVLRESIDILHQENDIYVHVDRKSNIDEFAEYKGRVVFVADRHTVHWGSFSQIEVMLGLLKAVSAHHYDYIVLLSGDCLPVKSSERIKEFFTENKGKEFIGVSKNSDQEQINSRLKYNYNKLHYKKQKNKIEVYLTKLQNGYKLFPPNDYYKQLPKLYKGSNWFCITGELCDYILEYVDTNAWYKAAFERSFCGDEVFFQTIVMNSKFRSRVYQYDSVNDDCSMALRYINWGTGPDYPKLLTEEDFDDIEKSECIIARKFDDSLDLNKYREFFNI